MEKIKSDWSKEDLDDFLKKRYGYGYIQFEKSLEQVHLLYSFRKENAVKKSISEEINTLTKIKDKTDELLDNFLCNIHFYENSKVFRLPDRKNGIKWPTDKKRDFIEKTFKLSQFYSTIDNLIAILEKRPSLDKYKLHH